MRRLIGNEPTSVLDNRHPLAVILDRKKSKNHKHRFLLLANKIFNKFTVYC